MRQTRYSSPLAAHDFLPVILCPGSRWEALWWEGAYFPSCFLHSWFHSAWAATAFQLTSVLSCEFPMCLLLIQGIFGNHSIRLLFCSLRCALESGCCINIMLEFVIAYFQNCFITRILLLNGLKFCIDIHNMFIYHFIFLHLQNCKGLVFYFSY